MAEPSRDHPGFDWIMSNLDSLMTQYPNRWVVADQQGLVAVDDLEVVIQIEVADRQPEDLAIVFMDPKIMRSLPPEPGDAPLLSSSGSGGVTFDEVGDPIVAEEVVGAG
jgi:hypothetical protein